MDAYLESFLDVGGRLHTHIEEIVKKGKKKEKRKKRKKKKEKKKSHWRKQEEVKYMQQNRANM